MSSFLPPVQVEQTPMDVPDELKIPLPASVAGSECGEDVDILMATEFPTGQQGDPEGPDDTNQFPLAREADSDRIGTTGLLSPMAKMDEHYSRAEQKSSPLPTLVPPSPLKELFQSMQTQAHEICRFELIQSHVQSLVHYCGITGRLIPRQAHLYRLMVNSLKADNSTSFASFYTQSVQVRYSCIDGHKKVQVSSGNSSPLSLLRGPPFSWIHTLPLAVQRGVVLLFHRIRTDPNFLARRIVDLSSSHLDKLTRLHRQSGGAESILQSTGTHRSESDVSPFQFSKFKRKSEDLVDLASDPMFLLLHSVFDTSIGPRSQESRMRCDVWSTTCARIIEMGKPGSDGFCMAVLDAFANMHPWPMKMQLELFLMELIQTGAFIFDTEASQPLDFTRPEEVQDAAIVATRSKFFDDALRTLVDMLTGHNPESGMPQGVLDLIYATLRKIETAEKKSKAQKFFIRWYCTSFISNVLKYPETVGIMMSYYIGPAARQKIFYELALRLQKCVFDAMSPWKNTLPGEPTSEINIAKLLGLFDDPGNDGTGPASAAMDDPTNPTTSYLMFSPSDVLSILHALYPNDASNIPSESFAGDTLLSTASSVTGSSTLTSGSEELRTSTASSIAASISGTSITSNGSSNRIFVSGFPDPHKTGHLDGDLPIPSSSCDQEGSPRLEECPVSALIIALSRVVVPRAPSVTAEDLHEERHCVIYIERNASALSTRINRLDQDLANINNIIEEMCNSAVIDQLISKDDLYILINSLVHLSQKNLLSHGSREGVSSSDILERNIREQLVYSESQYDFNAAHFWSQSMELVMSLAPISRDSLFQNITRLCQARTEVSRQGIIFYQSWLATLQQRQESQDNTLRGLANQSSRLRNKMWYLSSVRHSSTFADVLNVTQALKRMSKSAQPKPTGVTAWARQRLRFGLDRAHEQALEVLTAPKDYGGHGKLSDDQAELTSRWLTRNSVENFCKGEERIHRFCFEVQKCTNKLVGNTLLESPVLWSSNLYQHEKRQYGVGHGQPAIQPVREHQYGMNNVSYGSVPASIQHMSYSFNPPFDTSDGHLGSALFDHGHSAQPSFRTQLYGSIGGDWIGNNRPYNSDDPYAVSSQTWTLPPSPVSPVRFSPLTLAEKTPPTHKSQFINHLKEVVISLLLSEFGSFLWNDGSETDRWVNDSKIHYQNSGEPSQNRQHMNSVEQDTSKRGQDDLCVLYRPTTSTNDNASEAVVQNSPTPSAHTSRTVISKTHFPFDEAYRKLLIKFRLTTDPYQKLQNLYDLMNLIDKSHGPDSLAIYPTGSGSQLDTIEIPSDPKSPGIRASAVPRTRLTRLEEVLANCEDRRLNSMRPISASGHIPAFGDWRIPDLHGSLTQPRLNSALRKILEDSSYGPYFLFRDLQYIAAFVPSSILDNTPQGTAFWTVGLAAIHIKSNLTQKMTHRANQIVTHYYDNQPKRDSPGSAEPQRVSTVRSPKKATDTVRDPSLSSTTLADAAKLYTLSALEGDPIAARELALFHLTHPDLVQRVTLPLSRPGEVFKMGNMTGERIGRTKDAQRGGLDPMTFAVAVHWMEVAANAGDRDARAFLEENGHLGRGW